MKITEGTKVYIRDDLIPEEIYGANSFEEGMIKGQFVTVLQADENIFFIEEGGDELKYGIRFEYTPEMVDFTKKYE